MAYAAVTSLHNTITNFKDSKCFLLLPQFHQLINPAYEELKSLQQILRRLDATSKGRSRKKVNELDSQIKEAVWKFEDLFESHVYPQILDHSYLAIVKLGEHLRHDIVSLAGMLKEKAAEYVSELADLSREDGEAPSDQTADC